MCDIGKKQVVNRDTSVLFSTRLGDDKNHNGRGEVSRNGISHEGYTLVLLC